MQKGVKMPNTKSKQDIDVPKASSLEESIQMSSVDDERSEHRHGRRRAAAKARKRVQQSDVSAWAKTHNVELNPRNVGKSDIQAYGHHLNRSGRIESVFQTGNNVRVNTPPETSVGRRYLAESESATSRFFQRLGNFLTGKGFNTNFEIEEKHAQEVEAENQKAAPPKEVKGQKQTPQNTTPASPAPTPPEVAPLTSSPLSEDSVLASPLAMPPEENSALMQVVVDEGAQEMIDDDLSQYQREDYQEYIEAQNLAAEQTEEAVL